MTLPINGGIFYEKNDQTQSHQMIDQVFIQTSRTTVIDVPNFDITVKELSLKYLFKTQCREGYPSFRYGSFLLESKKSLSQYDIKKESTIMFTSYRRQPFWLKKAEIDSVFMSEKDFIEEYINYPQATHEIFNYNQKSKIINFKNYLN